MGNSEVARLVSLHTVNYDYPCFDGYTSTCVKQQESVDRARARASGFGPRVSGFGFRVSGFGFRVSGFRFRVSGFGFRVSGSDLLGGSRERKGLERPC